MEPAQERMLQAYDAAPQLIKDALAPDGAVATFVLELENRYRLHIDVAGQIASYIRDMLLGLISPSGFVLLLEKAGISDSVSKQLVKDLNGEVFVPLRNKMRNRGDHTTAPVIPHTKVMEITAPQPNPLPVEEPPAFNLIRPDYENVHTEKITGAPTRVNLSPPFATPAATVRTMQHDMDLVQHGSVPASYPAPFQVPAGPHPSQMTPAREFQTASVPFTSMSAPSRPIATEPQPLNVPTTPIELSHPPVTQPIPDTHNDPYREPI